MEEGGVLAHHGDGSSEFGIAQVAYVDGVAVAGVIAVDVASAVKVTPRSAGVSAPS
ncbi:hypothetical protein SAURM35S_03751 [Streptomyces aurantiogriseus]